MSDSIATMAAFTYDNFSKFTASLKSLVTKADENPEIQCEILRRIVHRINITRTGFEISFYAGMTYYRKELGADLAPGSLLSFGQIRLQSQNSNNEEPGKLMPLAFPPGEPAIS